MNAVHNRPDKGRFARFVEEFEEGTIAFLLGVMTLMAGISTADDLTQIGSPWGVQESSPWASRLLSLRGCWIFPVSIVWSAAAIAASFPPSWCADC